MMMKTMDLNQQIEQLFSLSSVDCRHLNTPTNDVYKVSSKQGEYALKAYNVQSRGVAEVNWEVELIRHLVAKGVPSVKPILGSYGYVGHLNIDGLERVGVLFGWAAGEKPSVTESTFEALGKVAAEIHQAADSLTDFPTRDNYDANVLIDEQLGRMKAHLVEANRWEEMVALSERMNRLLANPKLDRGICHMDLTLDNVHVMVGKMTVFDFDSAGTCWRALEPYGVLKHSREDFVAWLKGYRSVPALFAG
jgi:Ser/Thr protein kinase RdoA (MazF antagonist)